MIFYVAALYLGFLLVVASVDLGAVGWILTGELILLGCVLVVDLIGRDR